MDYSRIIAESELSAGFGAEDVEKLAAIAQTREYAQDEYIIQEEDVTCDIFIIYEGCVSVEIHRTPRTMTSHTVRVLKNEGVVGEFSFVDRSRRSATVKAEEDTRCLVLPCGRLEQLIENDYRLGYLIMRNIARIICSRIRKTNFEMRDQLVW